MVAGLLLLLLGAPESDPGQLLRIAWASQYEWKEDSVKNVTLEFTYEWKTGTAGTEPTIYTGTGQVVIVGNEVVRRHYPDLRTPQGRSTFDEHLGWVVRRFVRKPFEVVFKEAKFGGPEETALGQKVSVGPRDFYIKNDRFAYANYDVGTPKKPHWVLLEYTTGALAGGYGILKEKCDYTRKRDGVKVIWTRVLETKEETRAPVPASYSYQRKETGNSTTLKILFDRVRIDAPDPVVMNPEARDALKAAWEKRFTLPAEIRIEGQFLRRIDNTLDKARWWGSGLRGEFQVWGMDKVEAALDEKLRSRWRGRVEAAEATCRAHIKWIFGMLDPKPFDQVFKNCGFELQPQGDTQVVQVYGYAPAIAFKIEGDAIVGVFNRVGSETGWWEYKVKATSDGLFMLDRMKREIEGKKIELHFRYGRVKGFMIPKKWDVLGIDGRGNVTPGVAEYSFRKVKVTMPE